MEAEWSSFDAAIQSDEFCHEYEMWVRDNHLDQMTEVDQTASQKEGK